MNNSKVKVTANKEGHVIVKSGTNAIYGHIRVEQVRMVIDDVTGFAKRKKISALIPGIIDDLKGFGWSDNQEIEGKIRIVEQLYPFNKKDPDRDLKIAGESGIVCCKDGTPIYRKHFYTQNISLNDINELHNNEDEILQAYEEAKGYADVNGNVVKAEPVEVDGNKASIQHNDDFNL